MQPLPIKVKVISSISNEANCFRCSFIDNLSPVNDDMSVKFGFLHLEMPVPSQGHYGFHSFPVVD
jgi:hypothetical protein